MQRSRTVIVCGGATTCVAAITLHQTAWAPPSRASGFRLGPNTARAMQAVFTGVANDAPWIAMAKRLVRALAPTTHMCSKASVTRMSHSPWHYLGTVCVCVRARACSTGEL